VFVSLGVADSEPEAVTVALGVSDAERELVAVAEEELVPLSVCRRGSGPARERRGALGDGDGKRGQRPTRCRQRRVPTEARERHTQE
jgi:hypothetical protein